MYSPVLHVGSRMWMLGKIENHSARPLDEDEIDDLCKKLNARQEGNKEAQHNEGVEAKPGSQHGQPAICAEWVSNSRCAFFSNIYCLRDKACVDTRKQQA